MEKPRERYAQRRDGTRQTSGRNVPAHSEVIKVQIVAAFQPVIGCHLVADVPLGRRSQHVISRKRAHIHVSKRRTIVYFMPESTVHLQRNIKAMETETYIGTQRHFGRSLSRYVPVLAVCYIDCAVIIEVGYLVMQPTVAAFLESDTVRKIENAQRLPYNLVDNIIVSALKSGAIQVADRHNLGC